MAPLHPVFPSISIRFKDDLGIHETRRLYLCSGGAGDVHHSREIVLTRTSRTTYTLLSRYTQRGGPVQETTKLEELTHIVESWYPNSMDLFRRMIVRPIQEIELFRQEEQVAAVEAARKRTEIVFPSPSSVVIRGKLFERRLYGGSVRYFGPESITGDFTAEKVLRINSIRDYTPTELRALMSLSDPATPVQREAELEKCIRQHEETARANQKCIEDQRKELGFKCERIEGLLRSSRELEDRLKASADTINRLAAEKKTLERQSYAQRDFILKDAKRIHDLERINRELSVRTRCEWDRARDVANVHVVVAGELVAQAQDKREMIRWIGTDIQNQLAAFFNV